MQEQNKIFGITRSMLATLLAIVFHVVGLIGILYADRSRFEALSAYNLLLMFGLIIFTQKKINKGFLLFMLAAIFVGIVVEMIGVNTGYLFGEYQYGEALGPKMMGVPLLIGINWFITILGIGIGMKLMLDRLMGSRGGWEQKQSGKIKTLSIIIDGGMVAVLFDWIMEPVAIKLGFWQWAGGSQIPFYNYVCWMMISMLLLLLFRWLPFDKTNKFPLHLLLIQTMFFLILRTML